MAHFIKRSFDIGVAGLALMLLAPTMLFLAVAIYLADGRPVLVPEDRIDRRGRTMTLLAFRTDRASFNSHGDPTPIPWLGLPLRCSSLDKLPRLWNLLRGDVESMVEILD